VPHGALRYAAAVQVFLIRHAEAVDGRSKAAGGGDPTGFAGGAGGEAPRGIDETVALRDPHRHLTVSGRQQARAIGDRLRWHDCTPTHIWSSPLVRALQTAELVTAALQCELAVEAVPALAPDENPREALAALAALPGDSTIIVVGHEPGVSALGALLIGRPELAGLHKAEAVRIVDGVLRWRFAWNAEAPEITAG